MGWGLGLLGWGRLGSMSQENPELSFGMKVHYYNRTQVSPDEEKASQATYHQDLKSLLASFNLVVCINCPLTEQTRGMIGEVEIACMKDGAFLVNTGRGPVVDEKALLAALWSGKIARAGLDVFDNEPKMNPFFRHSDKVIVQPHMEP